ncbi:rhodanese-like domain-containing protein [Halalkalibacterium ligniniphilum]|uniref:rhodanese-like domain-containing protein n=1 Tax=Halalkalibacterium ligniniphilum TaxID=1134413 RepID=UPI000349D9BC|nr:rhodanese-like domain-containing protein [Halalkalibacterium ligniniphilum]
MAFVQDGIEQIEAEELKALLKYKETMIIDVREPDEYEEGHIPGVPLIPMSTIPKVAEQFDQSKSYVFVCRSGSRSHHVALFLKDQGIENVKNYYGGMLAWTGELAYGLERVIQEMNELYEKE